MAVRLLEALRDLEEPTIRDRLVGLVVIAATAGALGIVIALVAAELFAGALGYEDWAIPRLVGNEFLEGVKVYPEHYLLMGVAVLVPALYLLAFAIGIARGRGWAVILGLVAGGLLTMYGILALVIPKDAAANAERWHPGDAAPFLVSGVFLAWYFNRRAVRRDLGWGDPAIG